MADPKLEKKAQNNFLQTQRQAAPQAMVGSPPPSPTGIPVEGLILKPTKRTKEEEERLAKTPSANMGGARINAPLTSSSGSYVNSANRTRTDQR